MVVWGTKNKRPNGKGSGWGKGGGWVNLTRDEPEKDSEMQRQTSERDRVAKVSWQHLWQIGIRRKEWEKNLEKILKSNHIAN